MKISLKVIKLKFYLISLRFGRDFKKCPVCSCINFHKDIHIFTGVILLYVNHIVTFLLMLIV